ncbi:MULTISPECIES: nuclear transport factor 2 family protein [Protofrankia]|uniref:SnoaL-like domain-containing protein n=1 Tax=Protofrankia coriariae TaxID=1562887 RepID=A0ABR5F4J6_9ACTN|nr:MULTISPECIES: nuclear transport factor 2 family protein [Protofrankia]KLL11646.1 hypothetical protein FrCorBMG51_09655 [Protofrankia coriariae]ONH35000.1 hypothetical protein BL254_13730 [Protofrankia sp. BMG5.30]
MDPRQTADAVAQAMTSRDHAALMALYAEDIVFSSPVTAVRFTGRAEVGALMSHVLAGFQSWERTFVFTGDDECVFGARGRIGGHDIDLAEHFRLDPTGRVAEISIYGRPLAGIAAIAAIAAVTAPPLAARHGRNRERLVGRISRGLPGALARGDRLITRLAR